MTQAIAVEIEGYLTQQSLAAALQAIVGDEAWAGSEIKVPGARKRWDMACRRGGETTVVEYDGDAHYRSSLRIKKKEG